MGLNKSPQPSDMNSLMKICSVNLINDLHSSWVAGAVLLLGKDTMDVFQTYNLFDAVLNS